MDQLAELRARRLVAQGLHSPARTAAEVAAVDRHEVVRAWPMRGTLHFLPAEDARWMMRLCGPRVARAQQQRRPGLGLSEPDVAVAREALHGALRKGPLTRPEVYEVFRAAGVDPTEGRGPHLVRALGGEGDVVQGPRQGAAETFVHVDDLPVAQRELDGGEALAELGTRYLHSHGPASVKDLVWWAGLTVAATSFPSAGSSGWGPGSSTCPPRSLRRRWPRPTSCPPSTRSSSATPTNPSSSPRNCARRCSRRMV